jgi:NMD protein affecting ribosome stability and mRNA decay
MQLMEGASNDAFRPGRKAAGPLLCQRCGAVFRRGRWTWGAAPAGAVRRRCPACQRIDEDYPAGYIAISGAFLKLHGKEVIARVRQCEAQEKTSHPLERVMTIQDAGALGLLVTTTSVHLARLIGHALHSAFKGKLRKTYSRGDNVLRVRWSRDA